MAAEDDRQYIAHLSALEARAARWRVRYAPGDGEVEAWYVAYVAPKGEADVARRLERQGFEAFFPMMSRWVTRRHRRVEVRAALFPRYLFVGAPRELPLYALTETEGVQSLISNGGAPVMVGRKMVSDLRAAETGGQFVERPAPKVRVGEIVKCMRGPFEGLLGKCIELKGEARAQILIDLLKREVVVNIRLDEIARVA